MALAAATTKTVLQVATPSTTSIRLLGWGVSFDGAAGGTQVPVICQLFDGDVAATVTSLTPDNFDNTEQGASLCVGGASATGFNATAEGTLVTAPRELDAQHVSPQTGYGIWFPEGARTRPRIAASRFLRIRCTAPAIVNVIPWVVWIEPS